MQLYRGMDIGTAKLTRDERGGVPHHLMDVWEVTEAASVADTVSGYQQAEAVLPSGMPAIPLWYYRTNSGYSTKVQNVKFDSFGNPVYTDVEVKKK